MGVLHLGIGSNWEEDPLRPGVLWREGFDWGQTNFGLYFFTQDDMVIRPGHRYPLTGDPDQGTAAHRAYFKVWDSNEDYDPNPDNWRFVYGGVESNPNTLGGTPDAVMVAWADEVIARLEAGMALDPATNRFLLLDDETMHVDYFWGRQGQSNDLSHYRHETVELIEAHNALFQPYHEYLISRCKARWPNDLWSWYNRPRGKNKQPPYDGHPWVLSDEPPVLADESVVDEMTMRLIEAESTFMHGWVYMIAAAGTPMETREKRKGWWTGNLSRYQALNASLQLPLIANYWLYNSPASDYGTATEYDKLVEFFEVCVELGIEHATVSAGRPDWDAWIAASEFDRGGLWRAYVEAAAFETGFLTEVPVTPTDPTTPSDPPPGRHKPNGTCYRIPLVAIVCGDPSTGEPTNPGQGFGTSQTNPTIRRVEVWQVGYPGATGQLQLGGSVLYSFPLFESPIDPGVIIGPRIRDVFTPADPADPSDPGVIIGPSTDPIRPLFPSALGPSTSVVPTFPSSLTTVSTDGATQPANLLPSNAGFTSGIINAFMYNP